jgi:hypothetical protein
LSNKQNKGILLPLELPCKKCSKESFSQLIKKKIQEFRFHFTQIFLFIVDYFCLNFVSFCLLFFNIALKPGTSYSCDTFPKMSIPYPMKYCVLTKFKSLNSPKPSSQLLHVCLITL